MKLVDMFIVRPIIIEIYFVGSANKRTSFLIKNAIKDPHWYAVQEGDARMLLIASQPGQKKFILFLSIAK